MYISKKILSLCLLLLSFLFWAVYANSSITWLNQPVTKWDIITSEYYNNLNWTKSEWKFCKYLWWKLVCIDDIATGSPGSSNIYHDSWNVIHNSIIAVPTWFTKTDCSFIASAWEPMQEDGGYKRSRHYSWWYVDVDNGWQVFAWSKSIKYNTIAYVTSWTVNYLLICSK